MFVGRVGRIRARVEIMIRTMVLVIMIRFAFAISLTAFVLPISILGKTPLFAKGLIQASFFFEREILEE